MRMIKKIMLLAVLLPALSVWAGDLTTDNLTVTKDATIMGNMYFSSTVSGTNEGGTATGGTITTNGNYRIHTFTNVGTTNFVVSGGSLTCDVLVVAGGGAGGGNNNAGGGGAGGLIYTSSYTLAAGMYAVTNGAGGIGQSSAGVTINGNNSSFGTLIAYGGGGGNGGNGNVSGASGGSGGGNPYAGNTATAGQGTNQQGYAGGKGQGATEPYRAGGGGGGGTNGTAGSSSVYGVGGDGLEYSQFASIGGSPAGWFAGGGGGGCQHEASATGGKGGGGNGGEYMDRGATPGIANTGGGGGGSTSSPYDTGGSGGSGIVIVRYSMTTSSNITTLSISSNGISQTSASGTNVLMGKVGIGTNNPAEKLHVVGNLRVDGTNIVSAITLGNATRTTWPTGNLSASNNLSDITNPAAARANLGLGSAATNNASAFDPAGAADAVSSTLSAHTANLNNPHQVTASQMGALTPTGNGSQLTGIAASQVGALAVANNLSDVANASTARTNLGLGTAATNETSAFLSTTGGVVNGSLDIQYIPPKGDFVMGSYTNQ